MHVARRALWAVGSTDEERAAATCTIDVYVKEDVESISSPAAFENEITGDALHNFSVIALDIRGPRGRITVYFARKPHPKLGPPRSGVLLVVSESDAPAGPRGVVQRAIERRTGRRKRHDGDAPPPGGGVRSEVLTAVPSAASNAQKVIGKFGPAVVGAISFWLSPVGDKSSGSAAEVLTLLAAALLVGIIWVATLLLIPRVEVQAVTRAKRAADLIYKGIGAALVTALVGVAVTLVFGGGET